MRERNYLDMKLTDFVSLDICRRTWLNNCMMKRNGFATKSDLKKLENKMDRRFEQVDRRFEQVDKRFIEVGKRFGEVRDQILGVRNRIDMKFEFLAEDLTRKFTHEWQKKIDPILVEIEKHREKEIIWAEQNRRTQSLVERIAEKVGVKIDED